MAFAADLRAVQIASDSLTNDVRNLKRAVLRVDKVPDEESKTWQFAGHQGRKVLVDRRAPTVPPKDNLGTQLRHGRWARGRRRFIP